MKLDITIIAAFAEQLEDRELQTKDTAMITAEYPEMDWDGGYAIQDAIRLRKIGRGSRIIGVKASLT
jgi:2-oxo-3-hexenedioate decarboxylase